MALGLKYRSPLARDVSQERGAFGEASGGLPLGDFCPVGLSLVGKGLSVRVML